MFTEQLNKESKEMKKQLLNLWIIKFTRCHDDNFVTEFDQDCVNIYFASFNHLI